MWCFQGHQFNLARIIRGQKKALSELRTRGGEAGIGGDSFSKMNPKIMKCPGLWETG